MPTKVRKRHDCSTLHIGRHLVSNTNPIYERSPHSDNRFDPAMDKKSSFRTKQILCVPIKVSTGNILGVMQCINTVDDEPFTEQDEKLLELVAQQLGQVLQKVGDESSTTFDQMSNVTPTYTLDENFKLNIRKFTTARLFSDAKKVHRHVRCTVTLYHGGKRLGKMMSVDGNPTIKKTHPTNSNDTLVTADFGAGTGQWVTSSIPLCNLPHGTRIIFQLHSKNGHACGWTGCNLFEFDHSIRQGSHNLRLWPGECPTSNVTAMERKVRMGKKQSSTTTRYHLTQYFLCPVASLVADERLSLHYSRNRIFDNLRQARHVSPLL